MDSLYISSNQVTSSKKKLAFQALALLAVVGVIATVAVAYTRSPSALILHELEVEEQEFQVFMSKYQKVYATPEEYHTRFQIFRDNAAFARVHNSQEKSWSLGVNQFSDLTSEEFKNKYTPYKFPQYSASPFVEENEDLSIPSTVDWRQKGAVTAVKNQGDCGSCWSFSTTGAVEGAWFLGGHSLVSLSEQELVDCSTSYGNAGCNGGLMTSAFKFAIANGLTTEANYPYTAKNGQCNTSLEKQIAAKITTYSNVSPNNSNALLQAVAQQPVSVAVQANQRAWQSYTGGIVTADCGTDLDHGVLIVGYDNTNSPPYWIVKNSWGASWGEEGYIRIGIQTGKGLCGINMTPSYPTA
ncbi:unnamed protein product [Blepharisma stoltei]|uniref:Uncharacterized protein n=1 Tax=Blepharisma stoltei TaxID=1481888 RepID=A0AAU9JJD6_9CILI|nr:unnamed protein product [Blepharisma stoltei]